MTIARAIAACAALLAVWPVPRPLGAQPASIGTFPIAFTVALEGGAEVVTEAWLTERVAQAVAIFAPSGVTFVARERRTMPEEHARMEGRADRHALGGLLVERSINVLVVSSLRDVDDPSIFRQGVHWRSRTFPGTHYVILSRVSHETTLAHELGHFFGNPHSDVPNNIMSYARDGSVLPFFDDAQLGRIRGRARRFLRTGEIVP
jgi:hypothetical protein